MFRARGKHSICGFGGSWILARYKFLGLGELKQMWFGGSLDVPGKNLVPANSAKVWMRHLPRQLQIIGDKGAAVLWEFLCWLVIGGITVHSPAIF